MATYFISETALKANSYINENVDMKIIKPTILLVQDIYIHRLLGSALFKSITAEVVLRYSQTIANVNTHSFNLFQNSFYQCYNSITGGGTLLPYSEGDVYSYIHSFEYPVSNDVFRLLQENPFRPVTFNMSPKDEECSKVTGFIKSVAMNNKGRIGSWEIVTKPDYNNLRK